MKEYIIMSGYIRYRPKQKCYLLMVNSRILSKYLKSINSKIKGKVIRDGNLFFLSFSNKINSIQLRDKELVISIPGNEILKKSEIIKLKRKGGKLSFPIKVKLEPKELGLNKYYFYPDKDAAKLANELELLGANIPNRIFTSASCKHDLEFKYKNKEVLIEITRKAVSSIYQANFKHQQVGGNIRAHIFEVYKRCVTDKILKINHKIGFVIIPKDWKYIKHIQEIIEDCKLVKCFIIFTDFSNNNWARGISKSIIKTVN